MAVPTTGGPSHVDLALPALESVALCPRAVEALTSSQQRS
jgi:hypothetical protein